MEERWNEHVKSAKQQMNDFQKAITEYGGSNFTSEVLEYCSSTEELCARERFWIKHFNTVNCGYNMKIGSRPNLIITKNISIIDKKLSNKELLSEYIKIVSYNNKIINKTKYMFSEEKIKLINIIKRTNLISLRKINFYISKYKNRILPKLDFNQLVYNALINSFKTANLIYYTNNRDIILQYISLNYHYIRDMSILTNTMNEDIFQFALKYDITMNKLLYLKSMYKSFETQNLNYYVSIEKEYFKLRISNDKRIDNLKSVHNDMKKSAQQKIKDLKNISIKKINFNVTMYKSNIKVDNISIISLKVFEALIGSFDNNNYIYYENNKEQILNYIKEIYKIHNELKSLNKELNSIINTFIKNNNITKYMLKEFNKLFNDSNKMIK